MDRLRDIGAVFLRHPQRIWKLLLFLCGWFVVLTLMNGYEASIWGEMPRSRAPQVKQVRQVVTSKPPYADFGQIVEANLFKVDLDRSQPAPQTENTAPTPMPVPEVVEKSTLPAEVIGTLGGPEEVALALIRDKRSKDVDVYRVGEKLFDRALIIAIRRGEVEVLRDDKREVLKLIEEKTAPKKRERERDDPEPESDVIKSSESDGGADEELQIEQTGDGDYVIDKESFDAMLTDIGPLLTQARVIPNFEDGNISGYKIFAIKDGSVFEQIGLRNGDIIHSVNDVGISTPERALQLFQQLRAEKEFKLDIERNGSRKVMNYALQ